MTEKCKNCNEEKGEKCKGCNEKMSQECKRCYGCETCITCEKYGPQQTGPRRGPPQRRGMSQRGRQGIPWINSLTVFPTNRCNLRCGYCFIYKYKRKFGDTVDMSLETAKKMLIWLLGASGPTKDLSIHWFGGEPLVAFDMIKEATEWGTKLMKGIPKTLKWGITSNLTLIDDDVNEFLKKHEYNVLCSVDGLKKSHDRYRVYPDGSASWDDAIAGLKRVLTWNKDRTIRWTLNPDTLNQIIPGTEYFLNMGPQHIAHEFVYEIKWRTKDLKNLKREFEKLIPIVIRYLEEDKLVTFKPFRDGSRAFTLQNRMTDRCGLAKGDVGLDVDGNLFRCHRFVDQYEHHFGSIWEGLDMEKMTTINRSWNVGKIVSWDGSQETCVECPARMGCNAGCLAVNWDTTKNIFRPPRAYCDIAVVKVRATKKLFRELKKRKLFEKYMTLQQPKGRRDFEVKPK